MFCIRKKASEIFASAAPGTSHSEIIAIDCLPYCKVCLELQKTGKEYTSILSDGRFHPALRFVYVLINGIQSIIEYRDQKVIDFMVRKLENPESISEEYLRSFSKEMVDGCFEIYHSFYDLIEEYYPMIMGEPFDHKQIHEEIRKCGMDRMIAEDRFGLKHMLHHIHLILFSNEYDEALETACRIYLRFTKTDRRSFSRSVHTLFGEHILLIGSALDEGDAEESAVEQMKAFLSGLGVDVGMDIDKYDSHEYVIERRMFNMIKKKFGVTADEVTKGLYPLSSTFEEEPCLFPRLLISSDEQDLVTFKEVLGKLS